jgi:magnesium-transporting ATPase (P-type)
MNLFNQINCRVLDNSDHTEWNVFKTLFNNYYFWIILVFEMIVQHLFISGANTPLMSAIAGTAPITSQQNMLCWILGSLSLASNLLVKKVPISQFKFMEAIDLEHQNQEEWINKVAKKFESAIGKLKGTFTGGGRDEEDSQN